MSKFVMMMLIIMMGVIAIGWRLNSVQDNAEVDTAKVTCRYSEYC